MTKSLEKIKGFCCFTVSRHFWIRKVSINMRNDQILWTQKSQETWKRPNSLSTECAWKQEKRPIPLSMECSYKHEKRPNLLNTKVSIFVTDTQTLHHYIYIIIIISNSIVIMDIKYLTAFDQQGVLCDGQFTGFLFLPGFLLWPEWPQLFKVSFKKKRKMITN